MTSEPHVWEMYGYHNDRGVWVAVGSERYVRDHGYSTPPIPVTVARDPEGDYMGWIAYRDKEPRAPILIQRCSIFNVSFGPGGYQAEEKHNRGEAIRLTITIREVQDKPS